MSVFGSSLLGKVALTDERKAHIRIRHPEMKIHIGKIGKVLKNPDEVRISRFDETVLLFYKYFARIRGGKYLSVTVKTEERNFVLTAYFTDRIKAGEIYEKEKKSS